MSETESDDHSFRVRYLGTEEKQIGVLGMLLSGLGFLLSVGSLFFVNLAPQDAIPWFILVRDIILVSGLILLLFFMTYRYARRESTIDDDIQPFREKAAKHLERIQELVAETRCLRGEIRLTSEMVLKYKDQLFHYYLSDELQNRPRTLTSKDRASFDSICFFITSDVKQMLLEHFRARGIDPKDDIAISVKLIITNTYLSEKFVYEDKRMNKDGNELVITVYRDPDTYNKRTREIKRRLYDINGNTAFREIIEYDKDAFIGNDLRNRDGYHNRNDEWQQFYNSACVVPIRYLDKSRGIRKYYGFITADSLETEGQSGQIKYDDDCKRILALGADALATFFLFLALNDGCRQEGGESLSAVVE